MALPSLLLGILLFQGPGDGWVLVPSTRQVKRLYWDLFQTTEVWLSLIPEDPAGTRPLVTFIFQAFFPGQAERDPYSGRESVRKATEQRRRGHDRTRSRTSQPVPEALRFRIALVAYISRSASSTATMMSFPSS